MLVPAVQRKKVGNYVYFWNPGWRFFTCSIEQFEELMLFFLNFPIVLIWILWYRNNLSTSVLDLDSLHPELDPGILLNPDAVW